MPEPDNEPFWKNVKISVKKEKNPKQKKKVGKKKTTWSHKPVLGFVKTVQLLPSIQSGTRVQSQISPCQTVGKKDVTLLCHKRKGLYSSSVLGKQRNSKTKSPREKKKVKLITFSLVGMQKRVFRKENKIDNREPPERGKNAGGKKPGSETR